MRAALLFPVLLASAATAVRQTRAEDGSAVVFETGRFDVLRGHRLDQQAGIALRSPLRFGLEGEVGVVVADESIAFFHVDVARELSVFGPVVLRPSLGVTLYHDGAGKALGLPLEFRTAVECDVRLGGDYRIGIAFYHLSNAALARRNPGEESLVLVLRMPIRIARRR